MNEFVTHKSCPHWCAGHSAMEAERPLRQHLSETIRVGKQDDLLFTYAASVCLTWWADENVTRVHVARHRTGGVDRDSAVHMPLPDAQAWADILDGVGSGELADAIRRTLALLGDEEASR